MKKALAAIVPALLILSALASGILLFGRQSEYAACEKELSAARKVMDAAGLLETFPETEDSARHGGAQNDRVQNEGAVTGPASDLPAELFGRLLIPQIGLDLPVMRPPKEEPEKYLTRDFTGASSVYGSVYFDPSADLGTNCLVLYGHHMKNGAMFGKLGSLAGGDAVTLLSRNGNAKDAGRYEVAAMLCITPEEDEVVNALALSSERDAQILSAKAERTGALYRELSAGKKHLLLVTCEYKRPEERLIVLCEE